MTTVTLAKCICFRCQDSFTLQGQPYNVSSTASGGDQEDLITRLLFSLSLPEKKYTPIVSTLFQAEIHNIPSWVFMSRDIRIRGWGHSKVLILMCF